MTDLDKIVDQAANVPVHPKRQPSVKDSPKVKKSDKIKETAIAVIADTLASERTAQGKIIQKVDKSTVPVKAVFQAFQEFEKALGGRAALLNALQHCPESSHGYGMIQKLLEDPDFLSYAIDNNQEDNVRYSLAVICNRHRIPFNAIIEAFKDSKTAEIAIASLQALAPHTPMVVEQMAKDAQNSYHACHICEGTGRIWRISDMGEWLLNEDGDHVTQLCHNCRGQGKVFKDHDVQNRKMFLQVVKILEDKKGPLIAQTFNQNANIIKGDFLPGDGSFENLIKAIDKMHLRPVIDVEVIEIPNVEYEVKDE